MNRKIENKLAERGTQTHSPRCDESSVGVGSLNKQEISQCLSMRLRDAVTNSRPLGCSVNEVKTSSRTCGHVSVTVCGRHIFLTKRMLIDGATGLLF